MRAFSCATIMRAFSCTTIMRAVSCATGAIILHTLQRSPVFCWVYNNCIYVVSWVCKYDFFVPIKQQILIEYMHRFANVSNISNPQSKNYP